MVWAKTDKTSGGRSQLIRSSQDRGGRSSSSSAVSKRATGLPTVVSCSPFHRRQLSSILIPENLFPALLLVEIGTVLPLQMIPAIRALHPKAGLRLLLLKRYSDQWWHAASMFSTLELADIVSSTQASRPVAVFGASLPIQARISISLPQQPRECLCLTHRFASACA